MPDEINDQRRAKLAAARFMMYVLIASVMTMGLALPLLLLTPARYRQQLKRNRAGRYNRFLQAGWANRGGLR